MAATLDSLGRIMPRAASLYGDKTALAIGWLHTGDLASMDEDGCIFIVDRKKDMILTAGYNVYPAELERVIAAHPSVALVAG